MGNCILFIDFVSIEYILCLDDFVSLEGVFYMCDILKMSRSLVRISYSFYKSCGNMLIKYKLWNF